MKINIHNYGLKDGNENGYFKLMFLCMQNEEILNQLQKGEFKV
jgi:hypothetical protein